MTKVHSKSQRSVVKPPTRSWGASTARQQRSNKTQDMINSEINFPDNTSKRAWLPLADQADLKSGKPYKPDRPRNLDPVFGNARKLFDSADSSMDPNDLDMGF